MRRTLLPLLVVGLTACASDYKVTPGVEDSPADDTAPPVDEDPPEDTGTEPEDTDPPDDEPGRPVAVCDVYPNPVTPPTEAATWDGSASYDPDGIPLTNYTWTLVDQPTGSTMTITGTGPVRGGFVPLLGGTYTGQLVVTNEAGVDSNPCEIDLEVTPAEDLWIEMFWTHSGDDMDLHLLAPGRGESALETTNDCYYANCVGRGLEWGASGSSDNPVLDLDDIPGTGPENINIDAPEESTYTVYVHDYPGSVYTSGNSVTVNVYLDGALVWTGSKNISGENSYTPFASINYATRVVSGL